MTTKTNDAETGRLAAAREKVSETAHVAIDSASEALATARDAAGNVIHSARDVAADAYAAAADKASTAYSAAREKTGAATRATADGIEANPLIALAGGIAIGLIAGVLLPKTSKEAELLGPLGTRLGDVAREALGAAKQAGLASFDEVGLNRDSIKGQVDKLIDGATKAATAAGGAAVGAAKNTA